MAQARGLEQRFGDVADDREPLLDGVAAAKPFELERPVAAVERVGCVGLGGVEKLSCKLALNAGRECVQDVDCDAGGASGRIAVARSAIGPPGAVSAELLHSYAAEPCACCLVAQTLIGASSGAMRLAHRALEMHALDLGYRTDAWVQHAVDGTDAELSGRVVDDEALPVALEHARLATLALTRATASAANESMLVADALGHLFVIYLIAVEVASAA